MLEVLIHVDECGGLGFHLGIHVHVQTYCSDVWRDDDVADVLQSCAVVLQFMLVSTESRWLVLTCVNRFHVVLYINLVVALGYDI